MSEYEDEHDKDGGGEIEIITPTAVQWKRAAYLQLRPCDTRRAMQLPAGRGYVRIPLLGTVRYYAIELVWKDDTWDFLHFGTDLPAAKAMVHAFSAQRDVQIRRLFPKFSDVEGY
ncbi:hypothetical protein [Acidisoma cladoniae]|uniref:hypothetical protein n=1 Tax=Acidisoma cladoniae TaxID=3040935 RepID=UPI00254ABA15|nr:hypothetical protein [Acidisoma sp. PAMC 29798]